MPEPPELDESLYSLSDEELKFYLAWTGISDEDELKRHILDIQARAYKIFPYPCIRRLSFTRLRLHHHPAYKHALEYGKTHQDALYLELGCCSRKIMLDGFPPQNIVATDLHQEFWNLGFELFNDDSSKCPISFVHGDILASEMLDSSKDKTDTQPDLANLHSLNELLGRVSIIHAAAFFHLFSEENQRRIAGGCISLLSRLAGTMVFGSHIGASKPGEYQNSRGTGRSMFCHSPQSWEDLWQSVGQGKIGNNKLHVWAKLIEMPKGDPLFTKGRGWMVWCAKIIQA
ncbi:hypothetical protein RhiJN_01747 [Ceratobasidium sp. AG-Ba]|nr:hypothetical protein RhiJN_01747 [Ceratobasidium sp. AG-Ba]QRW02677.1 hypothetical protein RhiLY_01676 [Ceratobasidium sp. AG-Ba]